MSPENILFKMLLSKLGFDSNSKTFEPGLSKKSGNTNVSHLFMAASLLILLNSCKKFVEIEAPKNQIVTSTVFSDDATAIAAIRGIYSEMMRTSVFASGGATSITLFSGLSADEFKDLTGNANRVNFFTNSLLPTNSEVKSSIWEPCYKYIYYANSIIEGLASSNNVSSAIRNQILGESKFIRAFCHFYLLNLFGDIPLITSTDYRVNSVAPRTSIVQVYQQIILDLKDAQNLLVADYSFSPGERIRPNKWAATALLSRVYLYTGDWVNTETEATAVINNTSIYDTVSLNNVFLKNSKEAIWQLKPVLPGYNTWEGTVFIPTGTPAWISLSSSLVDSFEINDKRKISWVGNIVVGPNIYFYPNKYKIRQTGQPLSEYSMVLRLAEQYLIRAEARAQQNNITGAQTDINLIRNRAGLPNTTVATKSSLLTAIEHERQVELFSEWGHRWLDLKRTNRADAVLNPIKTINWQSTDVLYPIPQSERSNNPNLTQNPGY